MIDEASAAAVAAARWNDSFVRPLHGSYCFAGLPGLIRGLFGAPDATGAARLAGPVWGRYDKVVLLFLDAFGWRSFERFAARSPFLDRFVRDGVVTRLTAQFPSTTAAHVTAIHTGLPVGQSGVYEWFYYEPLVDRLIAPLLFSFAEDTERETLAATGLAADAFFALPTLYTELRARGVASYVLQSRHYATSSYSRVVTRGAELLPFSTVPEALTMLASLVGRTPGPAYYFLYCDTVDAAAHAHGPGSAAVETEIIGLLAALENLFHARIAGKAARTLVLVTADHGQVEVNPATALYVNELLPELYRYVKRNGQGRPLAPAGSARDMFIHVEPAFLDEAEGELRGLLAGRAEVHRVASLIAQGFFGAEPLSPTFLARVGDLVVLPYAGETVWWREQGRGVPAHYGAHGGLTPQEMETYLLLYAHG